MSSAAALSLALAALAAGPAQAALDQPVATGAGLVKGSPGAAPGVTVFKGIPFAAPPVGPLRWKAPQPAAGWSGVRAADRYGNVCMQAPGKGRLNLATDLPDSPKMSEDCLYLNLWTPASRPGQKLPVMLWVYGGAYSEGAGSMPISDGEALAKKGVIVVTFNYRVGAFGFLAHPELTAESGHHASGNYALMDAIAALKWIRANIAAFGGDPENVTLFGQSAGACMDAGLVGSPEARGLFRRAVSESGAWMGLGIAPMTSRERAEAQTVEAAQKIGARSLADLRAMPAEEVMAKLPARQGMIVDGWIIPEELSKTFSEGRQNPVDVLVGANAEEGNFTAGLGPPMTAQAWREGAEKRWGSAAALGLAAYPAATDEQAKAAAPLPFADAMAWQMRLYAESQAKLGKQAWLYRFAFRPPSEPGKPNLGAVHAAEIAYVFDNLALPHEYPDPSSPELSARDPAARRLADQMSSYWVNFARTGNPNGPGLPQWPSVKTLGPTEAMVLDAPRPGRGPWLSREKIQLYQALYARDVQGR